MGVPCIPEPYKAVTAVQIEDALASAIVRHCRSRRRRGSSNPQQEEDNMTKKNWWNPLTWLAGIWEVFSSIVGGFLRLFGFGPTSRMQHENLQVEDVDRAYNDAAAAENIADFAPKIDQRARGFLRYIDSSPEDRAAFDLSVFDQDLQDFILGLSEDDIEELRRRGPVGQLQAALIGRIPPGLEMKTAPYVRPEPSKEEVVRERFLAAVRGLPQDEAETYGLDYAPGR